MPSREKNLRAFVGLIGEAMESLANKHEKQGISWPALGYVHKVKEETVKGMMPIVVSGGTELGHGEGYSTKGEHETIRRGGVKIAEFIKEPGNLFEGDRLNKRMGAVLVHEYCHGLQDAAMENMPETIRAMIPIASIEHANQALAMSVWDEMNRIVTSNDNEYVAIRERLQKQDAEAFEELPEIDPEVMRYQDRVSKYPGAIFMEQHPEYFKENSIEADVDEGHLMDLAEHVSRQVSASNEWDMPLSLRATMADKWLAGKIDGIDQFMGTMGEETGELLEPFGLDTGEQVENIVGFYERELKHWSEIERLGSMKGRQLSPGEMDGLRDFVIKNEIAQDLEAIKPEQLVDFALAHKVGELEANREGIERAADVLGARLHELHKMGRDPEAKLKLFADPQTRNILDEIRSKAKKKEEGKFRESGKKTMDRVKARHLI